MHNDNVVINSGLAEIDTDLVLQEDTVITNSYLAETNTHPFLQEEVIINNFLADLIKMLRLKQQILATQLAQPKFQK